MRKPNGLDGVSMTTDKRPENTINIIIETGEFTFNDAIEAQDAKTARDGGRAIANFALSLFAAPRRRMRRDSVEDPSTTE